MKKNEQSLRTMGNQQHTNTLMVGVLKGSMRENGTWRISKKKMAENVPNSIRINNSMHLRSSINSKSSTSGHIIITQSPNPKMESWQWQEGGDSLYEKNPQ
jgi:hypothetical protein